MRWTDPVPNRDTLLNKALPKWSQMIVTGKPVTEEQALEIIRRTDFFFLWGGHTGNNEDFEKQAAEIVGMPWQNFGDPSLDSMDALVMWQQKWGVIFTEYVTNDWLSSAFACGPHGWCHPNGTIGYADNVGKWPTVSDILDDWSKLAVEFPFLDLVAVLTENECCEHGEPLIAVTVKDGDADLSYPGNILFDGFPPPPNPSFDKLDGMTEMECENAISLDIFRKWASEHAND